MTTPATALPTAPPVPDRDAVTIDRVSDLLIAHERADPRRLVLRPIADLCDFHDGTGDLFVFATVFVDLGDGRGPQPHALNEVRMAAACLADDPPFPAAPCLSTRLIRAAEQAATAAKLLNRSLMS